LVNQQSGIFYYDAITLSSVWGGLFKLLLIGVFDGFGLQSLSVCWTAFYSRNDDISQIYKSIYSLSFLCV